MKGVPYFNRSRFTVRPRLPQAHGRGYHSHMSSSIKTHWTETLPDPLPGNPFIVVAQWLAQARADAAQPNPNAMVLATVDERGHPSARVVLCKEINAPLGYTVFYTNYRSRKGRELEANRRAAVVFHWDHRHRQVRAEGVVEPLSDAENDAYFRTRPWQSRRGCHRGRAAAASLGRISSVCGRCGTLGGRGVPHPRPRIVDAYPA